MAEWSNAHDSKSCYVGTRTEVRILFSAPENSGNNSAVFYFISLQIKTGVNAPYLLFLQFSMPDNRLFNLIVR